MKLLLPLTCVMIFATSAVTVFAGEGKGDSVKPAATQAISWDEFRARCQSPKDFDKQSEPENIQISCTDSGTEFVNDTPGVIPLASSRHITTAVYSSKWHVGGADAKDVAVQPKPGNCLRYKEVQLSMTIQRPATCSEILGFKGGIEDYCASALDEARAENPKMVSAHDTGRYIDTCSDVTITNVNPNVRQ